MKAVSDTSPLCFLVLIDEMAIVPALFDEIFAPGRVAAELKPFGSRNPTPECQPCSRSKVLTLFPAVWDAKARRHRAKASQLSTLESSELSWMRLTHSALFLKSFRLAVAQSLRTVFSSLISEASITPPTSVLNESSVESSLA